MFITHLKVVMLQTCTCDLTANKCDINCCCDPSCTELDELTFSSCTPINENRIEEVCVSDSILFSSNGEYNPEGSGGGLFCIYKDNYNERSLFTNIAGVNTLEEIRSLESRHHQFSYKSKTTTAEAFQDTYTNGDQIYIVFDNNRYGYLSQPSPLFSTQCQDENPARFLNTSDSACVRRITNLQTQCTTDNNWNAQTYIQGFKVAPFPSFVVASSQPVINATLPSTSNDSQAIAITVKQPLQCQATDGIIADCTFTDVKQPTYDSATGCSNVVTKVSYNIGYETNQSTVINHIEVTLTFTSLPLGTQSFTQTVGVAFFNNITTNLSTNATVYQRSGNPGYVIGLPVRAGNLTTDPDTEKSNVVSIGITLVQSTASGTCSTDTIRSPLTFGEDYRSGCFMSIKPVMTTGECETIQNDIYDKLLVQFPTHTASFGNTEFTTAKDWVTIVNKLPVIKVDVSNGQCINMITDITFEILFAKTGYIADSQNKIVGFNVNYGEARTLVYQCFGMQCDSGKLQRFQVTQVVTYVDVSSKPQVESRSIPKFKSKAPNDFFYPFF